MPSHMRLRPARISGVRFANEDKERSQQDHAAVAKPPPTPTPTPAPATLTLHDIADPSGGHHEQDAIDEISATQPPAKKRKLSIRHRQTTLDNFAVIQPTGPKPPSKVTRTAPHGRLLETINGTYKLLGVDEDELSQPTSGARTPVEVPVAEHPAPPQLAATPAKQDEKRTLRSQDEGPKLKSELAIYFSNYDEIILDLPKEQEDITVDSTVYIADGVAKSVKSEPGLHLKDSKNTKGGSPGKLRNGPVNGIQTPGEPQRSSSNQFNGSSSLNLDFVARTLPDNPDDPLTDEVFLKSHRRAERKEKQLRNIEKERAMHEKVQLERLLDGLLGHDWLRTMGITAITENEAKRYEAKRDYFVAEVKTLVDKFRQWKEQEKKQRMQKEALVAALEATEEQDSDEGSAEPSSSDLNASATRQLQQETASAMKNAGTKRPSKANQPASTPANAKPPPVFLPPPPEIPITSFYKKKHLRDAALGNARHGRSVTAFGQPIPEMEEHEFRLPAEYVTEDTLRANARERRRRKRASAVDGSGT